MPVTRPGRLASHVGFSAAALNAVVRGGAAKDEQLFLAVGLAAMILTARLRRRVTLEYFGLCVGSAFVVGLFTIFPNLSTDYGSLRAFQEALIVIAPVLVEGSLAFFRPFGDRVEPEACVSDSCIDIHLHDWTDAAAAGWLCAAA